MKSKDLSFVLAALRRARQDPRMEHVQESLRKAQSEFEALGRSGKVDQRRLFRATKILCDAFVAGLDLHPKGPALGSDSPDDQPTNDK